MTFPEYKEATIGVEFDSGVHAFLPLLQTGNRRLVFRILQSTFAGCYGGLIADGTVSCSERQEFYKTVCSGNIVLAITGNPFTAFGGTSGNLSARKDFTQVLDLTTSYDDIWRNYRHSCRNKINKGRKKGFKIRSATTATDIEAYYDIYCKNLSYWGTPQSGYPRQLFETILNQQMMESAQAILWLITDDHDLLVGGNLVFYWHNHAVEWHAVFDRDYFQHGSRNYLVDHIIKDAHSRGFSVYDFNPSGGHEGVVRFKSAFGAEKRALVRWTYESPKLTLARKIKGILS